MYLLILFFPLFGSIITGLGGRWLGRYGASIISTTCVSFSFIFSILAFYEVTLSNSSCYLTLGVWIQSGIFNVAWGFIFDSLTCIMLIIITFISSLVHIYSIKYMETDPHCPRFMSYLEIFTFFMLVLVTSDNLVQTFLGWEGVGLASYLLINFWYTRLYANQSAMKALIINRIGDVGLSLAILLIFYLFKSVEYSIIFPLAPVFINNYLTFLWFKVHSLTFIGAFLFIGAIGKSAQLLLHTWLPDAMEGPTPVSALIHAATMVTAGVFLIIRFSPILEYTPIILVVMVVFGSLTAFFASMLGVFQNDLKKIIAYSTCSQLGYMVFSCGLSCYTVSIFHLFNHAFFKALLFLSAGIVIHSIQDEQDMRRMGSLVNFLPLTYSTMLIGSLALIGFPFLTGFYSKDFILELSQATCYVNLDLLYSSFACYLGNMSVVFTAFYSFRLIFLTFINNSNMSRLVLNRVYEGSSLMALPLIMLSIGSIFIGYLTRDFFVGTGTNIWGTSIFVLPNNVNFIEAEFLSIGLKWLPLLLSSSGIFFAICINLYLGSLFIKIKKSNYFLYFTFLINKKWYWDILYNRLITYPLLNFGYTVSFKSLDRGFIELVGPYGLVKLIPKWSAIVIALQTGQVMHYIFFMISGLCFLLVITVPSFCVICYKNTFLVGIFLVLLFFS